MDVTPRGFVIILGMAVVGFLATTWMVKRFG